MRFASPHQTAGLDPRQGRTGVIPSVEGEVFPGRFPGIRLQRPALGVTTEIEAFREGEEIKGRKGLHSYSLRRDCNSPTRGVAPRNEAGNVAVRAP